MSSISSLYEDITTIPDYVIKLLRALFKNTPAPPCDGCEFAEHCSEQHLACVSFLNYVETGKFQPRTTQPVPYLYHKIYTEPLISSSEEPNETAKTAKYTRTKLSYMYQQMVKNMKEKSSK